MINVAGLKVVPAEVEGVLLQHPGVAMAAVFGVPDSARGETVAACVVARADTELDPRQVRNFVRQHLSAHKCPRRFWVLPNLPLNAAGKTDKRTLRDQWVVAFGTR